MSKYWLSLLSIMVFITISIYRIVESAPFKNVTFNSSDIAAFERSNSIVITKIKPRRPTLPTLSPTITPSKKYSAAPSLTEARLKPAPTICPLTTGRPTIVPSKMPSIKTSTSPSKFPSVKPSFSPPTIKTSKSPSEKPKSTATPSKYPSIKPTSTITSIKPSNRPTISPTKSSIPSISKTALDSSAMPSALPSSRIPSIPPSSTAPRTRRPTIKVTTVRPSTQSPTSKPTTSTPSIIPVSNDIVYHGGPIMVGTVNLYNIYLGDFTTSPTQQRTRAVLDYFAANLGLSPLYATVTEYYQNIDRKITYASNSLRLAKTIFIRRYEKALKVSRGDFLGFIAEALNSVQLPIDDNGIYAVIFRGDFIVDGFLTDWCGFHGIFVLPKTNTTLKFFVVGDPETATNGLGFNCEQITNKTINNSIGGDSMANIYAHEVAETVTNSNRGWFFERTSVCPTSGSCAGLENADMCNWNFQTDQNSNMLIGGRPYLIQSFWQLGYGCVLGAI